MPAPMRMPASLTVEFRYAHTDQTFTNLYRTKILRPGVEHPREGAFLYDADYQFLANAHAIIGVGCIGDDLATGLYVTIDGMDTAWINGVRTREEFRSFGYGSTLVDQTQLYISKRLGIQHFALTVRCDDQGTPNDAAFKTYERCGFQPVGRAYPVTISGDTCDRHLGSVGTKFLTQRMEARS